MKKKIFTLMFGLLLAVGWTTDASAQLRDAKEKAAAAHPGLVKQTKQENVARHKNLKDLVDAPLKTISNKIANAYGDQVMPTEEPGSMLRAPRRANYNETSSAIHDFAWYDAITYNWVDKDGPHTSKITEPATNAYQMAYLVGSTYMNPQIPGIKYSKFYEVDHPYGNIDFGYDIPNNPRWGNDPSGITYSNITISVASNYIYLDTIQLIADGVVLQSWNATDYRSNQTLPQGWQLSKSLTYENSYYTSNKPAYYFSNSGTITINSSSLSGKSDVRVYIHANSYYADRSISVNGNAYAFDGSQQWESFNFKVYPSSGGTSVTMPYENGYTVFLVKVKDGTAIGDNMEDLWTTSWNSLINYFTNYIDGIELLTDGIRVGGTTSNAGTVFSYTGNLNRFYFIGKGKDCYLSSLESTIATSEGYYGLDIAPFYSMYEEFSPTTTDEGDQITDFFEKMDQGEAYGIQHDCRSVNAQGHYFSMTGKTGTTHNTMSNLVLYIPDDRGQKYVSSATWRNYDHQPRVGLYTAELEATATPTAQEHVYDVTCDWSSSLETILGFDEPEWYDLWVVVKDDQGNIVLDSLLTTTDQTTYTYQVPQYPESYTIEYIVRAWPKSGPDPVDHNANSTGTFFADSDPDQVLIPGYKDFISIIRHHYESDFDIDAEYNYYRNFMTLGNQNGTNGLTTERIDRGENVLNLFRYDYDHPEQGETEAATLTFTHQNNQVNWEVVYHDQQYYPKHAGGESKYYLSTMQIPTSGSFTVGSSGGSNITIVFGGTSSGGGNAGGNFSFSSIQVKSGGSVIPGCSWTYASHGTSVPTGWTFASNSSYTSFNSDNNNTTCYISGGGTITIPSTMLNGATSVQVVVTGYCDPGYTSNPPTITVNGSDGGYGSITSTTSQNYTWTVNAGESAAIDVSGIQLVDQFRALTAYDTHPYHYGYRLQYTGKNTAEWDTTKTSNVLVVPVKHSESTLNGFYTFEQMIHDSIPELLEKNVKNGDLEMTLKGDGDIFYYTINRRPDNGNTWDRMSYVQFDNNHTFYTEGVNYLPQYAGDINYPGDEIERLDNKEVLTGNYNDYMKYGPVVWTYGYNPNNRRHYFTTDSIHNSYGAPVWKTGVGQVTINGLEVQRQVKDTQTGEDNPSTTWTDGNGATCNIFFVGLDADGLLPTTNMLGEDHSNYYEPYMFRVWAKSNSGALRGFTPVTTEYGDKVIDDPTADHNMQVIYEEYTNSNKLNKPIPAPEDYVNARNIIKFGALKTLAASDVEIIVRFYYKVKHLDPVDDSMDNLVVLDFVDNAWEIETGNANNWQTGNKQYTAGEYTIGLANKYYYNDNIGFLMLGENGTLTLPSFNRKVKQIQVVGRPGASSTVKMNVFVGGTAVSTEVTGSTGTSLFDIDENYQEIGTNYTIKVTNNYNAQITTVIVVFEEEETNNIAATQPKANDRNPVATRRDGSDLYSKATNNNSNKR